MQVLDNESNNIVILQNSNGFWLNFHKIPYKIRRNFTKFLCLNIVHYKYLTALRDKDDAVNLPIDNA